MDRAASPPLEKAGPTSLPRPRGPSLRGRLRGGFALVAVACALLAAAAVASLDRLGGAIATLLRENYASVIACEQMKEALERQDSAALFDASGRRDIAEPILAVQRRAFAEALAVEERNITVPGEAELVRDIRAGVADYERRVDEARTLPEGARQDAYFRELLPRFTAIKDKVQSTLRLNQEAMERADRDAKLLARRTVNAAIAVSLAMIVFLAWFAVRLLRSIDAPLGALRRSAIAIGEGNLDVHVAEPDVVELRALAQTFNRMAERLRAYRESSLGELLAAKDVARATLEGMLDPVVVVEAGGGVVLANEAAELAFAVRIGSAEELREAGVELPEELARARDQALESGAPVLPRSLSEAVRRRAEGTERYYLVRALPLRAAPGEEPRVVVVAQDVTRFRRIDDLKSDMVATVSHELKTPLTSLRMATHLLLEPMTGSLTEAQTELVTTARDDTERLRAMVEDLLDVVRIEGEAGALRRAPVDVAPLLHEVEGAHRSLARDKGVELSVEADGVVEPVSADRERLSIALANLVSNAIRHTPAGGSVKLRARSGEGALRVEVADTGEGIDPKILPRIFDRSFTTASGGAGRRHGLGLAIAREIALQHGGEVHAESTLGKGSVFSISIPR